MDTTSPVSNRSDVSMEANDVDERRQETTEAGDEIEAEGEKLCFGTHILSLLMIVVSQYSIRLNLLENQRFGSKY